MIRYLILIPLSVTQIVSHVEIKNVDSYEWSTQDGSKKPTLKISVQGESIQLSLREAPFCHLADTKKCECFILRKDQDSSRWDVASLVKCGDKIQGSFMSNSEYIEIAPREKGKSGEHVVKNYKPSGDGPRSNSADATSESDDDKQKGKPVGNQSSFKYIRPLPEYEMLPENETGYITTMFVVSKLLYEFVSEPDVDVYLQNYVNQANLIISKLNMLIIYKGWVEASDNDTYITESVRDDFVEKYGYIRYDHESVHDAVILFGPAEKTVKSTYSSRTICLDTSAHFVVFLPDKDYISARNQLKFLLFSMGKIFFIETIVIPGDEERCGQIPENIVWVMEGSVPTRNGTLKFADCSVNSFRGEKRRRACFGRLIKPSRSACGNGLVEDGEECDCVADECKKCCNDDCKLAENSVCSNGPCCDVLKCQIFDDKTQCRASEDFCDIPELCDGKSSQCPSNYVVANGYECKGLVNRIGHCFNGICGNREDVCSEILIYGDIARDECYNFNQENGNDWGGCGPTFQSKRTGGAKYSACSSDNKLCGKLYCTQQRIEEEKEMKIQEKFYQLFTKIQRNKFYSEIVNKSCGYFGLDQYYRGLLNDPTFVPDGSVCGDGKMCVNQTCSPLPSGCPQNCPGKEMKHPYTGETFPAFILGYDDDFRKHEGEGGSSFWVYFFAVILLLMSFACGAYFIYFRMNKKSQDQPRKSSELSHPPQPALQKLGASQATVQKSRPSQPIVQKPGASQATVQKSRPSQPIVQKPGASQATVQKSRPSQPTVQKSGTLGISAQKSEEPQEMSSSSSSHDSSTSSFDV